MIKIQGKNLKRKQVHIAGALHALCLCLCLSLAHTFALYIYDWYLCDSLYIHTHTHAYTHTHTTLTYTHKHAHWLYFLESSAFSTFQKCDYSSYLLLCNKLSPNCAAKNKNIYYVYRGSENKYAGGAWLVGPDSGSLLRLQSRYQQGPEPCGSWLGLEGL